MFSDSSPVPGRAGDTEHERVDELMLVLVIRRVTAHQGLGDRLSDKTNVVFTYLDIYNICGQGCESNTKKWSCGCGRSRGYSITLNELDIGFQRNRTDSVISISISLGQSNPISFPRILTGCQTSTRQPAPNS
jgi:hypothetical protein